MSHIPDVRKKLELRANPFYEGNLDEEGKILLEVYDHCMGRVEEYFENLVDYRGKLLEAGFDPYMIDQDVMAADKDLDDYTAYELRKMNRETKVALAIGNTLLQLMECERNEFVVSMLEGKEDKAEEDINNG